MEVSLFLAELALRKKQGVIALWVNEIAAEEYSDRRSERNEKETHESKHEPIDIKRAMLNRLTRKG